MKKFIQDFKAFAMKGNVIDMAIGVIIGGAFSGLVESLTNNLMSLGKKKEDPKETVQAEATAAAEA